MYTGKGCLGVMADLLILTAWGFIVAGLEGVMLLEGGLLLLVGSSVAWGKGFIVAGCCLLILVSGDLLMLPGSVAGSGGPILLTFLLLLTNSIKIT